MILLSSCQQAEKINFVFSYEGVLAIVLDSQEKNTHILKGSIDTDSVGCDLFLDKNGELYLKTIVPQGCYNPRQILLNSTLYLDEKNTAKIAKYIDIASFKTLGQGYYQDKKYIYYASQRKVILIQNADCQSFKVLKKRIALDKKHHYFEGLKLTIHSSNQDFQKIDLESLNNLENDNYQDKSYKFFIHTQCIKQIK